MNENNLDNNIELENAQMTAGEMLRNARTTGRRKREIQTVAKQLCIREEFLQALEDGNYAAIPEVVYILGFARNYAMELGLDPEIVINKIKQEMGLAAECRPDNDNTERGACNTSGAATRAGFGTRVMRIARKYWMWIAAGVGVLVVLGALALFLVAHNHGGADDLNNPAQDAAPVQMIAEPEYARDVRERFGVENRNNADVILQARQESWVKVEDARGNTVFSRVLVPGDVYYVPGGASYKATFGNAGGIDIWVNGMLAAPAGPAHTRKSGISLNPETLAATVKQPVASAQD